MNASSFDHSLHSVEPENHSVDETRKASQTSDEVAADIEEGMPKEFENTQNSCSVPSVVYNGTIGLSSVGSFTSLGLFIAGFVKHDQTQQITSGVALGISLMGIAISLILKKCFSKSPDINETSSSSDPASRLSMSSHSSHASTVEPSEVSHESSHSVSALEQLLRQKLSFEAYKNFDFDDRDHLTALKSHLFNIINDLFSSPDFACVNNETKQILVNDLSNLFFHFRGNNSVEMLMHVAHLITTKLNDTQAYLLEIKKNICDDWRALQKKFELDQQNSNNYTIQLTAGETHNLGKKVCFITFPNGTCLVYKPRKIDVDWLISSKHPNSLFSIINTKLVELFDLTPHSEDSSEGIVPLKLPTYKILKKETHGYVKYLSHTDKDCLLKNDLEVERYYQTLGALEAIAEVFGMRDLHETNLLVHRKLPHLIDLEVTFNIKSLLYLYQERETGLDAAYKGGLQKTEVSQVKFADGRLNNQEQHEQYMEKGFLLMKSCLQKMENSLITFVEDIPLDLSMRYVPTATQNIINYMRIYPSNPQGQLEQSIFNLLKKDPLPINIQFYQSLALQHPFPVLVDEQKTEIPKFEAKKFSVRERKQLVRAYLEDLNHSDLPIMSCNLHGQVYYKNILIMDCSIKSPSLKSQADDGIPDSTSPTFSDSENLFIISLLKASIRNVSALNWPPKGWEKITIESSPPRSPKASSSNAPD